MSFFSSSTPSASYRRLSKTAIAIAVLCAAFACDTSSNRSTEERIAEEVAEKLAGWQARRDKTCHKKALEIATVKADSMILEYARENKLQLERPSRPIRPEEPELRRPNDTLKLAPFLGDSL